MEERQLKILTSTIREYIRKALPVSSEFIARHSHLGVSPATIRNEFLELTREGYLEQPHISAGRIPTNRGWRFHVDRVMDEIQPEVRDVPRPRTLADVADILAHISGALGICIEEHGRIAMSGLPQLFDQPDFEEKEQFARLAATIEVIESEWGRILEEFARLAPNILIGEENRFFVNDELSALFGRFESENRVRGLAMVVGPKRMPYERNWKILRGFEELIPHISLH